MSLALCAIAVGRKTAKAGQVEALRLGLTLAGVGHGHRVEVTGDLVHKTDEELLEEIRSFVASA